MRGPQSVQSVHAEQSEYSEPAPPSSQSPSEAWTHVLTQPGGPGGGEGGGSDWEGGEEVWQRHLSLLEHEPVFAPELNLSELPSK